MTTTLSKDFVTVTLKGGVEFQVPTEVIQGFDNDVYNKIFADGLELFLRKGMAKISKDDSEAITAKAGENLENLREGKLKATRSKKAKGVSGAIMTEARRLAKNAIKLEAKRQKIKVSHLDPKDITMWANQLLDGPQGAELIAEATANLENIANVGLFEGAGIELAANEGRVAKANKKAEAAKASKVEKPKVKAKVYRPGNHDFPPQRQGVQPQARH